MEIEVISAETDGTGARGSEAVRVSTLSDIVGDALPPVWPFSAATSRLPLSSKCSARIS